MLFFLYALEILLFSLITGIMIWSIALFIDWDHDRRQYKKWHEKHNS